jgi:hypothetical protein
MTIAKQNSRKSESVSSKTGFLKREVRSGSSNAQFSPGDDIRRPSTNRGIGFPRPGPRRGAWPPPCRPRRRSDLTAVQEYGRRVAKPLPAAAVGYRSISRNPPFGCDGDWRRHHRSPANGQEAGQESAGLFAPGMATVLDRNRSAGGHQESR